jgi:hypothetical protein
MSCHKNFNSIEEYYNNFYKMDDYLDDYINDNKHIGQNNILSKLTQNISNNNPSLLNSKTTDKTIPTSDKTIPTSDKTIPTTDKTIPTTDKSIPTTDKSIPTTETTDKTNSKTEMPEKIISKNVYINTNCYKKQIDDLNNKKQTNMILYNDLNNEVKNCAYEKKDKKDNNSNIITILYEININYYILIVMLILLIIYGYVINNKQKNEN